MSNFQPLEVVDRGSETQPKVGENFAANAHIINRIFFNPKSNLSINNDVNYLKLSYYFALYRYKRLVLV